MNYGTIVSTMRATSWHRVTYGRSRGSSEDETTEVGSALVAQGASGVNEGGDTVALETRAQEGGAPSDGGIGGLLGLDELLLGVGQLVAVVGLAENGGQDGELNALVEGQAEGNSRGLNGRKVYEKAVSVGTRSFQAHPCSASECSECELNW